MFTRLKMCQPFSWKSFVVRGAQKTLSNCALFLKGQLEGTLM
jgi:hypothetical protein